MHYLSVARKKVQAITTIPDGKLAHATFSWLESRGLWGSWSGVSLLVLSYQVILSPVLISFKFPLVYSLIPPSLLGNSARMTRRLEPCDVMRCGKGKWGMRAVHNSEFTVRCMGVIHRGSRRLSFIFGSWNGGREYRWCRDFGGLCWVISYSWGFHEPESGSWILWSCDSTFWEVSENFMEKCEVAKNLLIGESCDFSYLNLS